MSGQVPGAGWVEQLTRMVLDKVVTLIREYKPDLSRSIGILGPGHGGTGTGDGSATPRGPAGGDLGGTYPNPTVAGLQARPVAATAPDTDQVLGWDGTTWLPVDPDSGPPGPPGANGDPGPPGADAVYPPGPGGGAVFVSFSPTSLPVWAYPLTSPDGGYLVADDGTPLYIEAPAP